MTAPNAEEQARIRGILLESGSALREDVEYGGAVVEVRQPTIGDRSVIYRSAGKVEMGKDGSEEKAVVKMDLAALQLSAVIHCTYFKGCDVRVFGEPDRALLEKQYAGRAIDKLVEVAMRLVNVKGEVAAKKSEPTPSASSSSSSR